MLDTITPGLEGVLVETVTEEMGTAHAGPPILSTPSMILMMEGACSRAVAPHLEGTETTVGVHVSVSHVAPSYLGEQVSVHARLIDVDRRFLTFEVAAHVGERLLGEGTHKRAVVDPARARRATSSGAASSGTTTRPVLPRPTDDLDRAKADLDRWGYCLLADALDAAQVQQARTRLVEQAAAEVRLGVASFDTGAHPSKHEGQGVNQRVNNLVNKGAVFHEIALHERMAVLLEHMLGPRFLLTGYSANITAPECEVQMLHQDQGYVNRPQPTYPIVTNVLWMLDEFTVLNGGTHVVPGSHLVNAPLQDPPPDTVQLEGPAGTAAVVDGRTWHGAGANRSDRLRHVLINNYCRAWVRQQWNPFLGLAPEVEATLGPDMKRLLGFKTWGTLGGVGQKDGVDADGYVHRPERIVGELV